MSDSAMPQLSLFFPCYNEEKNIANTVNRALPVLKKISSRWEIILVNDGSKDNTLEECQKLVKKHGPNVRIVNHANNRGYGAAFKSGFYSAKYNWITFTDADGQFDFSEITKLISKQAHTNADVIIGYYLSRKVPFVRKLGSFAWQFAVLVLFGLKVKDVDCGFKLVSKKVIDTIPKLEAERGPFISSEFLIKSRQAGFKIVEVGVSHYERQAGHATGTDLNVIIAGFKDLFHLWLKENFQK